MKPRPGINISVRIVSRNKRLKVCGHPAFSMSCTKRMQALLFRQLQQLGCKGFAVLWDDIEPELTEEDAKHFTSFAEAHCKVRLSTHIVHLILLSSYW